MPRQQLLFVPGLSLSQWGETFRHSDVSQILFVDTRFAEPADSAPLEADALCGFRSGMTTHQAGRLPSFSSSLGTYLRNQPRAISKTAELITVATA